MNSRRVALLALSFLLASFAPKANGQVLYGSIVGNVTDTSSASVPGAVVKLTQVETNQSRELITNASGAYLYNDAPAGTYQVTVSKEGFQTFTARDIVVRNNSATRVDATLSVGTASQTVEVTAQAAALQTDRADVHTETTAAALEAIPVSNRSYQSLMVLTPGVTQPSYYQTGGINNPTRSMAYNVNGTPNTDVVVRIRRSQRDQPMDPAIAGLYAGHRGHRHGQHGHQQLRRGAGPGGRRVRQCDGQERHQLHVTAPPSNTSPMPIFGRADSSCLPIRASSKTTKMYSAVRSAGPSRRTSLFYFVSWEDTSENSNAASPYALQNGSTGNFLTLPNSVFAPATSRRLAPIFTTLTTGAANGTGRTVFPGNMIPSNRLSPVAQSYALLPSPAPDRRQRE